MPIMVMGGENAEERGKREGEKKKERGRTLDSLGMIPEMGNSGFGETIGVRYGGAHSPLYIHSSGCIYIMLQMGNLNRGEYLNKKNKVY